MIGTIASWMHSSTPDTGPRASSGRPPALSQSSRPDAKSDPHDQGRPLLEAEDPPERDDAKPTAARPPTPPPAPPPRSLSARAESVAWAAWGRLRAWVEPSAKSVGTFLNDTLLYIVSRHWVDLLSIQLFRLHPLPFCALKRSHLPCTPEAPFGTQARFALCMLLACAILRRVATSFGRGSALAWLGSSPMAGMLAGWGFGFACVQGLRELNQAWPGVYFLTAFFSLLVTAASAVFILLLRPSTLALGVAFAVTQMQRFIPCAVGWRGAGGAGGVGAPRRHGTAVAAYWTYVVTSWAALLEEPLEDLWRLFSKACAVMVMMVWSYTLKEMLVEGIPESHKQEGPTFHRLLLTYAATLTAICGFATVRIVRTLVEDAATLSRGGFSQHASSHASPHHSPKSPAARDGRETDAAATPPLEHSPLATVTPSPLERSPVARSAEPPPLVRRRSVELTRLGERVNHRTALIEFLRLLEQTFGWIIGIAWTDFVVAYFHADDFPTVRGMLKDAGAALLLTLLGVCWIVWLGYDGDLSESISASRTAVEKWYLNNALSFFVGWMWISFLRDLSTLCARWVRVRFDRGTFICTQRGESVVCIDEVGETSVYVTTALCMFLFTFSLTSLLLRFSRLSGAFNLEPSATAATSADAAPRSGKQVLAALLRHVRSSPGPACFTLVATLVMLALAVPEISSASPAASADGFIPPSPLPPFAPPSPMAPPLRYDTQAVAPRASALTGLRVVKWNVGSLDSSPFGYRPESRSSNGGKRKTLSKLLRRVQTVLDAPRHHDVPVLSIFTPQMWAELKKELRVRGFRGINYTDRLYKTDLSQRWALSGFIKDSGLADKQLISMADEVTSRIPIFNGRGDAFVKYMYRPSAASCYQGNLSSLTAAWWPSWKDFMFSRHASTRGAAAKRTVAPLERLQVLQSNKYPSIKLREEVASRALQALTLAIFDSTLLYLLQALFSTEEWREPRQQACRTLIEARDTKANNILSSSYSNAEVLLLQEISMEAVASLRHSTIRTTHTIVIPGSLQPLQVQTVAVLMKKTVFEASSVVEHTSAVLNSLPANVFLDKGDLLVLSVTDVYGQPYLIVSFRGEDNGREVIALLDALHALLVTMPKHRLILGLDADTRAIASKKRLSVEDLASNLVSRGYTSCWGDNPDPASHTMYNTRTYLQPKLHRVSRASSLTTVEAYERDVRDYIVFSKSGFSLISSTKDNTGAQHFFNRVKFPSSRFPSDHAIVTAKLACHPHCCFHHRRLHRLESHHFTVHRPVHLRRCLA
ncbi:hypothetical protein AB1Y20_005955 [Prymnesium parvum]|uniref:Endonuclease/exonuclease/phosphatase domain-containing protein n=1 Tax=Prymnesium parvum TaxID=97485 RepID=A0AB34J2I8_PRYPA